MPPQKQRRASLDQQLAEPPLLREYDHAVKDERRAEQVHRRLARHGVGVVERIERREGEQRGGERYPSIARDSGEREIGENRRAAKHEQHQNARREQLGGEVAPERNHGELYERVPADGEPPVYAGL